MNFLDMVLGKLGLIRKTVVDSLVKDWEEYTKELGKAAQDKGVCVLIDNTLLKPRPIQGDVFVVGSKNTVSYCQVIGGSVKESPSAKDNTILFNTYDFRK